MDTDTQDLPKKNETVKFIIMAIIVVTMIYIIYRCTDSGGGGDDDYQDDNYITDAINYIEEYQKRLINQNVTDDFVKEGKKFT